MVKVRMVKARLELQFYPSGSGYTYPHDNPDGNEAAEQEKLAAVLAACGKLGKAFDKLLPKEGREWWKQGGVEFEAVDGKVTTAEILKKVNEKLKASALKHKQLDAIRADLPEGLVSTNDYSPFPQAKDANDDPEEIAMNFVATPPPPTIGAAAYYSPPNGGPVFCCRPMSLTEGEIPMQLTEANARSGQLDVLLIAHFDPAS